MRVIVDFEWDDEGNGDLMVVLPRQVGLEGDELESVKEGGRLLPLALLLASGFQPVDWQLVSVERGVRGDMAVALFRLHNSSFSDTLEM